ncbi:hypothetical protein BDN72DRAFT_833939 [Pluteus cervinus]|uniref:Uncharacterized protein n=1 Tax=Pluteus cervinus TaxID=181527 RepID=A0ACD3B6L8_9AGAR|nr:hypothetical protein BDN72DRAFT_833939 [Pluteus cervinus]
MDPLRGASYAGLAFSGWETAIAFPDELQYIWSQPAKVTMVNCLYLFSRYFALAVHINNSVISGKLSGLYPVPHDICKAWAIYQTIVTYTMISMVDMILMMRIYAFYNRSKRMGAFLCSLLFIRTGMAAASAIMTFPTSTFTPKCLTSVPPEVVYLFAVGEVLFQTLILSLTFVRKFSLQQSIWSNSPLLSLLSRDGSLTFLSVVGSLTAILVYSRFQYTEEVAYGHSVFPIFVAATSSASCRMIINMQRLAVPRGQFDLTSIFDSELDSHPQVASGNESARHLFSLGISTNTESSCTLTP